MAAATMFSHLAVGFAETMAKAFETVRVEELTPEEISTALRMCDLIRDLFVQARRSIAEQLAQGVDARAFAGRYERAVTGLEAVLTTTQRVVTNARTRPLPEPAEHFVDAYRALMDDMLTLHQLLSEAVVHAKLPTRPIDWKRVQEAEASYARGDTKPFQRSPTG